MKKIRDSNFELLRIIAMIMVITLHFIVHGGILDNVRVLSLNFFVANLMESFSIYAVNLYILISAYFMCDLKMTIKKVVKIWIQVVFYTTIIYLSFSIIGIIKFNIVGLIESLLPIISNQYAFVTGYIVLLFLSPFLNKLINSMNKDEYNGLIIIFLIFFIILGVGLPIDNVLNSYIFNFIILYFIAAYIKKHIVNKFNKKYYLLLYIGCSLLIFAGRIALYIDGKGKYANLLLAYNSIFIILGSVGLFMFFINIKIQSKAINNISILTFGVYLIHDNSIIRNILYTKIFKIDTLYNNSGLILITIICILMVFVICSIIEYLRTLLFNILNINIIVINIIDEILKFIIGTANKIKNKIV